MLFHKSEMTSCSASEPGFSSTSVHKNPSIQLLSLGLEVTFPPEFELAAGGQPLSSIVIVFNEEATMVKLMIWGTLLFVLCVTISNAYAFRCGEVNQNLAAEGMYKQQILNECGPPFSKETVGVDEFGQSYRIVEEWIYIINEYGYKHMYIIRFNGSGKAVEIEWLGEQNSVFK
ncbi:MAG: DUF2845 domain-containing protein [Desulfosarcina sp.]|nr:DUF2845 domain-containing protein [Desulfosarcina sp.]